MAKLNVYIYVLVIVPITGLSLLKRHQINGRSAICLETSCPPGTQAVLCEAGKDWDITCEPCPDGTYQDKLTLSTNASRCRAWRVCSANSGMAEVTGEEGTELTNRRCRCMTELGYQDSSYVPNSSPEECLYCHPDEYVPNGLCVKCSGRISENADGHRSCESMNSTEHSYRVTRDTIHVAPGTTMPIDSTEDFDYLAAPDTTTEMPESSHDMNAGWIIAIVAGSITIMIICIVLCFCYWRNRKLKYVSTSSEETCISNGHREEAVDSSEENELLSTTGEFVGVEIPETPSQNNALQHVHAGESQTDPYSLSIRLQSDPPETPAADRAPNRAPSSNVGQDSEPRQNQGAGQGTNVNQNGQQVLIKGNVYGTVIVNQSGMQGATETTPATPIKTPTQNGHCPLEDDGASMHSTGSTQYTVREQSCIVQPVQETTQHDVSCLSMVGVGENERTQPKRHF